MQIILNGTSYTLEQRMTVHDLVQKLGCDSGNLAIAVNFQVIPKAQYLESWLDDMDQVEMVSAFQGG